jgi:hypothetical protein
LRFFCSGIAAVLVGIWLKKKSTTKGSDMQKQDNVLSTNEVLLKDHLGETVRSTVESRAATQSSMTGAISAWTAYPVTIQETRARKVELICPSLGTAPLILSATICLTGCRPPWSIRGRVIAVICCYWRIDLTATIGEYSSISILYEGLC